MYVSSFLCCNVISLQPPELPLKTFSFKYLLKFFNILSLPLLELPIKWLQLVNISQKPNLIIISNSLSKINPF